MKQEINTRSEKHFRALRCLLRYGPQTYLEVERNLAMAGISDVLANLNSKKLVKCQPKKRNLLRVYEISEAGEKYLSENDPLSRTPPAYRPHYQPLVQKEMPVREGSMRAYQIKSLGF